MKDFDEPGYVGEYLKAAAIAEELGIKLVCPWDAEVFYLVRPDGCHTDATNLKQVYRMLDGYRLAVTTKEKHIEEYGDSACGEPE